MIRSPLAVVFLFILSSCASVQVSQDFKAGTDFSRFSTYTWKAVTEPPSQDIRVNNPFLHDRFHTAIQRSLDNLGMHIDQNADLRIGYTYAITSRLEPDDFDPDIGLGLGRRRHSAFIGFGTHTNLRQYDVGILVIDIYDASGTNLLWRGTGSRIVSYHLSPEETTVMVNEMVTSILAQYPPTSATR